MKTHELAKNLTALARALRSLPNMEIQQLSKLGNSDQRLSDESLTFGLTTLIALSDVDKTQWQSFIEENSFPIEVRPRDASRDILGKLLTYLQNNREARNRLAHATTSERSTTAPELQRALQILLRS